MRCAQLTSLCLSCADAHGVNEAGVGLLQRVPVCSCAVLQALWDAPPHPILCQGNTEQ